MFKFITRQHFIVNLLVAIGIFIGLIFVFLSLLNVITRHNQYEKVPDIAKMNFDDAVKALEKAGFSWEVQDSVWEPEIAPLTVTQQSPLPGQMVKAHRIIFLTVNRSEPPTIEMPNFVGFSFRNAELYLKQIGLKLGDTSRKPDIARDAVLEQLYNGRSISPGTRIFQGSIISLVLGSGLGDRENAVPDLFGLTFKEAKALMTGLGINLGALLTDPDVKDTASGFVYRQNPLAFSLNPDGSKKINNLKEGQSMDLWISAAPKERVEINLEDTLAENQ